MLILHEITDFYEQNICCLIMEIRFWYKIFIISFVLAMSIQVLSEQYVNTDDIMLYALIFQSI
jgi:hypothetical protein